VNSSIRKIPVVAITLLVAIISVYFLLIVSSSEDHARRERGETDVHVGNLTDMSFKIFRAGTNPGDAEPVSEAGVDHLWLQPGRYFLMLVAPSRPLYYPVQCTGYRSGPDEEGSLVVTIRPFPLEEPPLPAPELPSWVYIPSGTFLLGDRRNPREPHHVWLTGFFIAPFEITNREFREFLVARDGYRGDANWTEAGLVWREGNRSNVSALLPANHPEFDRFGRPDQPVTRVNWFEADAFCRWLTMKRGSNGWWFSLPSEAEWEKAARGPDGFDFALGMQISDHDVDLYNWKKNPGATVTVVGIDSSLSCYRPNRYGLYHITGNVVEWTQSIFQPFSRKTPFKDDERNHPRTAGLRVARGGSWYSASIATMYIPYRDAFQPEHSSRDLGFRIVARPLP
jgi:formylglycine-generating enzyme required for sulfatase activity